MKSKNNLWEILWILIALFFGWLTLDCYVSLWAVWNSFGINIPDFDKRVFKILPIIQLSFIKRAVLLLFPIFVSVFYERYSKKSGSPKTILISWIIGAALFMLASVQYTGDKSWMSVYLYAALYLFCSLCGASLMIISAVRFSPYIINRGLVDNKTESEGFMQNTKLMTNKHSINLPMEFYFKGNKKKGWINILNPFRATVVLGVAGSGKTYSTQEEYHRQWVDKLVLNDDYIPTVLAYDYKFPALTAQNYGDYSHTIEAFLREKAPKGMPKFDLLTQYKEYKAWMDNFNAKQRRYKKREYPVAPQIVNINFTHPSLSYRCNCLKYLSSTAGAGSIAEVLYTSLNREAAGKKGDFFVESAKRSLQLYMWFCHIYQNGQYCSLPHTMELLSKDEKEVFPIFDLYSIFFPELHNMFSVFKGAYEGGAMEQLQGQLGSVRIGMGALIDDFIKWTLTEDSENPERNIDLDVNDLDNPKILWIGNDGGENEDINVRDKKEMIFGAAISAIFAAAIPVINKKHKNPSLVSIDELSTIYVDGLDRLIATARSNQVGVILGLQDNSQGKRDYGDKVWMAIFNTIGNRFIGAVKGETAKSISDSFGEKKIEKQGKTVSEEGSHSFNISEQREKKIPQDIIENLSQGEFVGSVADNFGQYMEHKEFHCNIIIDPNNKRKGNIPYLYTEQEREELPYRIKENSRKITGDIDRIILDTKELCDMLDSLKMAVKIYSGEIPKNKVPADSFFTAKEILDCFDDNNIPGIYSACKFFNTIYYISKAIPVSEFEYRPGDKVRAKAKVLKVPFFDDESEDVIIERMNVSAELNKAKILLKSLSPDTDLYLAFEALMVRYFPTSAQAQAQIEKYKPMYEQIMSNDN